MSEKTDAEVIADAESFLRLCKEGIVDHRDAVGCVTDLAQRLAAASTELSNIKSAISDSGYSGLDWSKPLPQIVSDLVSDTKNFRFELGQADVALAAASEREGKMREEAATLAGLLARSVEKIERLYAGNVSHGKANIAVVVDSVRERLTKLSAAALTEARP